MPKLKKKSVGVEALLAAYVSAAPPVHPKPLGRNKFAAMLSAVYPGIGPHKSTASTRERGGDTFCAEKQKMLIEP